MCCLKVVYKNCIFKAMNEVIIGDVVYKAFEKAKEKCPKNSKYALSKYIEANTTLSSKTLERAYGKYIIKDGKKYELSTESINLLCKYLGYENYEDYATKNKGRTTQPEQPGKPPKRKLYISLSIAFGVLLIIIITALQLNNKPVHVTENRCMAWKKNHYEEVSCYLTLNKKYGTKIEPYDSKLITNFKKVEVTMKTDFFTEDTNKPLIWYTKNKDGEIEYFTSPGLHPITGKTLDEITPYIIQKYVPLHSGNINSFAN